MLIVKPSCLEEARRVFENTGVVLTEGARDLGGAVGSNSFIKKYIEDKVNGLCELVKTLSTIAVTSPQAAHSAYIQSVRHKWTYLQRVHGNTISPLLQPLETIIREQFIPALLGGRHVSDTERELLSLPAKKGGMALENPTVTCDHKHQASKKLTKVFSNLIIQKREHLNINTQEQRNIKLSIRKNIADIDNARTAQVLQQLSPQMQRAVTVAQEKGASAFVTTLPLQRHNFSLSKTEFRDAILMRYMWPLPDLPSRCVCGQPFSLDHSQICHMGGFVNMRHDTIRNLLATEFRDVLRDVQCEPRLTPLTGEIILPASANREPDARADIRVRGFWADQQSAFFDVRVFYPHAPSYLSRNLSSLCRTFELEKKRQYNDRVMHVDHGTFTPLVFSSCGGMGAEAASTLRKLASMVAEKRHETYSNTIALLRMRISIALLRASIVCLRGTRSRPQNTSHGFPADVVLHELRAEE
jgi:hypothetical protein